NQDTANQDALPDDGPQVAVRASVGLPAADEIGARLQDDRHTGIRLAERGGGNGPASYGRIHHHDTLSGDFLEHDEMVEFPVQDRSPRQTGEVVNVCLHRPCRQTVPAGGAGGRAPGPPPPPPPGRPPPAPPPG